MPEALDGYRAGKEMLTQMGQRQRYLLGKYNKDKFFPENEPYCMCGSKLVNKVVKVESTDFYRTITSAQAELLGMYPMDAETCCLLV